ncbi:urease accessory protein UreF [Ancylobacter terrae]|uniref:urease accessory protein UreF n=1 Tax=Ancylobacter sp. sgz301288 TaxID=3342077 RepID=UPI00385ACD69
MATMIITGTIITTTTTAGMARIATTEAAAGPAPAGCPAPAGGSGGTTASGRGGAYADPAPGHGARPDLLPLFVWLSPAYPVGAFAYSHGLEWAVEAGDIRDAATLRDWIDDLLVAGGPFSDAMFLAHAWRAAGGTDGGCAEPPGLDTAALRDVAELAAAFAPSRERQMESLNQGDAFVAATRLAWPAPGLDEAFAAWDGRFAYPVAVGIAAAVHGLPLAPTLDAFLAAIVSNLVSAAVRLVPLGQSDGNRTIAALAPTIRRAAARAGQVPLDRIGGAAFRSDVASMRHETQYTRLFRS